MLNVRYLYAPFVLQMLAMAADELHFHRRRGLPRWERIGHPLDTLSVLVCFVWILTNRPQAHSIAIYAALCIFSCLLITKDEPVHRLHCTSAEQWLHAVMFVLHPLILICAGLLWPALRSPPPSLSWISYEGFEKTFLVGNTALVFLFGLYQFLFWNVLWRPPLSDAQTEK